MSNCRQPGRDARAQAESQAQAIIAQGRRMARQRLEGAPLEEEPMKRYAHPIPYCIDCPTPPPADGLDRILEALACQNQLLVELLGAVNALTAATLSIQSRSEFLQIREVCNFSCQTASHFILVVAC
ncbi:MAG: hypothetical protein ACLT5P_10940 [Flavonifractor plautii]